MLHLEVRKKIVEARKKGLKIIDIAKAYGVGESAIYRLLRQERETGDITPRTHQRGRKPTLDARHLEELSQLILSRPDITLQEMKDELNLPLGISAINAIVVHKLGFRFKKKRYTQTNGTEKM